MTRTVRELVSAGMILAGVVLVLLALAIVGFQLVTWLRTGMWPHVELFTAWTWITGDFPPHLAWVGIHKIFWWVLGLPISIVALPAGIFTMAYGAYMAAGSRS